MDRKNSKNSKARMGAALHTTLSERKPAERLTPLEERVIRMLHGLSEDSDAPLVFAEGASIDTNHRLALMEANNLDYLHDQAPDPLSPKQKIIQKLSKS